MKRKCLSCNYYNNGVCNMGENGTEYDEPFCELGHNICNLDKEEDKFCCYLSDKTFERKERQYNNEYSKEFDYKDEGYEVIGNIHDNKELLGESKLQ